MDFFFLQFFTFRWQFSGESVSDLFNFYKWKSYHSVKCEVLLRVKGQLLTYRESGALGDVAVQQSFLSRQYDVTVDQSDGGAAAAGVSPGQTLGQEGG